MIKSMTGWGQSRVTVNNAEITVEIKSVNNRYLDCGVKLPRLYLSVEEGIKQAVGQRISRGKVDVYVNVDASKSATALPKVNRAAAKAYLDAIRALADEFGLAEGEVTAYNLLRLPEVMAAERDDSETDEVAAAILSAVSGALDAFDVSRTREGERLREDVDARFGELERLVAIVEERSPVTVAEYRKKLETRLREVLADRQIDETRLLTEAAIFADKIAVSEETVRLRSHLAELRATMKRSEPIGRRLDFLVQEANREANTIGSKVNDAELARCVVDLKAEIEKIREQAQNIE